MNKRLETVFLFSEYSKFRQRWMVRSTRLHTTRRDMSAQLGLVIKQVGEKRGYWLIPNAPLISTKCSFFHNFFCPNQQKQNHSPKISFYVCDQAQLFPADLNTTPHTFFCMRSSRTLKKSHKIPTSL